MFCILVPQNIDRTKCIVSISEQLQRIPPFFLFFKKKGTSSSTPTNSHSADSWLQGRFVDGEANERKQGEEGRHGKTLVMFMCHESFYSRSGQQEPQGLWADKVTLIDCDERAKGDDSE